MGCFVFGWLSFSVFLEADLFVMYLSLPHKVQAKRQAGYETQCKFSQVQHPVLLHSQGCHTYQREHFGQSSSLKQEIDSEVADRPSAASANTTAPAAATKRR